MRSRPVENPHFTQYQATILLCIASAGLSMLRFQGRDLDFLALRYDAWPEEPWRLLTACLLHVNLLHLGLNLFWTLRLGRVLEPIFGSLAMTGVLLLLGAGSSAAQWAFSGSGIGLSGILYGLFGLAWALDRYHPSYRGIHDDRTTLFLVVWFFVCIFTTMTGILPIGNWAHGGGALLGVLLGMSLSPFPKRRMPARAGLAALIPLLAIAVTVGRPYVNFSDARAWELSYEGYLALERGEPERAVRLLEQATRRDGDDARTWHNLGVAYGRLGRVVEAAEAFRREEEARARGGE